MNGHGGVTRRGFMARVGVLAAGAAAPYMLTSTALGAEGKPSASERLAIGFIGVGGMGLSHVNAILGKRKDVEIPARRSAAAGARTHWIRGDPRHPRTGFDVPVVFLMG